MRAAVRPYLVADRLSASHAGWERLVDDAWCELGEALDDWDYNTTLCLRTSVTIDADRFTASTGLDSRAPLRWVVAWRANDGKFGATALMLDVTLDEAHEPSVVDVTLAGHQLGPVIELSTRLELADFHWDGPIGSARHPGSILWEHAHSLALAGDLARFPIAVVDFEAAGLDPDASWTLDVPDDLSTPVLGGLLLLLNERDQALVEAIDRDPDGDRDKEIAEGVSAALLDHAVAHADELRAEDWEEGSIGHTLVLLTARAPGGLPGLLALRSSRLAAYRATLVGQARRSGLGRNLP